MAQTADYGALITHVQDQETRLLELERENRQLKRALGEQEALATKRFLRVKVLHTLSLGILRDLKAEDLYRIAAQTVAKELDWNAAFVVSVVAGRVRVLDSAGAPESQVNHIHDSSVKNVVLEDLASESRSYSTLQSTDKISFALRVLFQAEEVVAVPIMHGKDLFGYLVACLSEVRNVLPSDEDTEFLAVLASHIGMAVYNTTAFADLEEQNLRLRELDELKDSFISITSHQLRTPLSIIKWILSILQSDKDIAQLTEQHKMIEQAYISNERLIHVVNDLLNASRIHEGHLPYTPKPTDLKEIAEDVCSTTEKVAESRQIKVEYTIDPALPLLNLDPIIFKSALQNLMDNATDYNQDGGWIKMNIACTDGNVVISVSNSGEAIPIEEQKKIFAQFYRSPEAVKMHPNGNGLGLYITEAIVRQHGGEISLKSQNGETTFFITIPLSKLTEPTHG